MSTVRFILVLMCVLAPLRAYAADALGQTDTKLPLQTNIQSPAQADTKPTVPPDSNTVDTISYLERIIEWNRAVVSAEQLMDRPREAVLGDKLHQDAQTVSQKSFDYARAEAAMAAPKVGTDQTSAAQAGAGHAQLLKAMADIDSRVADLKSQINRPGQTAQQNEQLTGELKLAEARQSLLQAVQSISSSENEGTLVEQVNVMARTARAEFPNQSKSAVTDTMQSKATQVTYGIFGLSEALMTASQKQQAIDALIVRTKKIKDNTHTLIAATRGGLKDALAEGDALTANTGQAADPAAYKKSIDDLVDHYKQLSSAVIPLGESNASLENVLQNLQEWKKMTIESEGRITHSLFIRFIILIVSIAVPLVFSSLAHRAIFRMRDIQRRKRLDLVRRVVVIIGLIAVVLANFLTEFGSLATFAGFATAGLAVGLQTVLVSMVAHSFYFGRYGVHVGDRVRVTDVTGEVLQMGLLRLYMRELKETDQGFVPTGKIVAFPNSVLFQPAAFYKYVDDDELRS